MRIHTVVIVLLVVALIVLAYYTLVGVSTAVPDVGESEDPTGGERDPIKYGVFHVKVGVKNEFNRFDGKFYEITCNMFDYVGGELTYLAKYPLQGWFEDDVKVIVDVWITGPGNYLSDKATFSEEDNIPEVRVDYNHYEFGPYKAYFWDTGTYTISSQLSVESDEFTGTIASYSTTFIVAS